MSIAKRSGEGPAAGWQGSTKVCICLQELAMGSGRVRGGEAARVGGAAVRAVGRRRVRGGVRFTNGRPPVGESPPVRRFAGSPPIRLRRFAGSGGAAVSSSQTAAPLFVAALPVRRVGAAVVAGGPVVAALAAAGSPVVGAVSEMPESKTAGDHCESPPPVRRWSPVPIRPALAGWPNGRTYGVPTRRFCHPTRPGRYRTEMSGSKTAGNRLEPANPHRLAIRPALTGGSSARPARDSSSDHARRTARSRRQSTQTLLRGILNTADRGEPRSRVLHTA